MERHADSRTRILDAALASFLARGYVATSIADVRRASGASTGSIYHFFGSKGGIALALIDRAVAGWSEASVAAFEPDAPAERAIKASVDGLVRWGLANPALLRFMVEIRTLAVSDPDFAEVRDAFAVGRALGQSQYQRFLERGEVRPLPWPLAHALMLGPAYDYLRLVAGGLPPAAEAPQLLAAAAWESVRARGT